MYPYSKLKKLLHKYPIRIINSQMKILSNKRTKDFVQIVDGGMMDTFSIVTLSVPYMWKWRRDYMDNRHT